MPIVPESDEPEMNENKNSKKKINRNKTKYMKTM
jgi:hypothetical protein